ncbi:hypothetical protein BH24ACT20_BH24ACT20_05560 [soil metagenome]
MTEGYGSESSEGARQRSEEVAQQGQQKASEYAEQGREQAKGQIATQKERASGELQGISRALRQTGDQLREQDQDSIGQYAEQAAEQAERLSNYLNEKDAEQLISEVEDFARNRPAVFLGGAFALGAVAARFLKSSAGQTGDLKEELRQEAEEVKQSATPNEGDSASGGESNPVSGGTNSFNEGESSYRVRGEAETR